MKAKGILVTDWTVWDDHPWKHLIPAEVSVRKGRGYSDEETIALIATDRGASMRHVDFPVEMPVTDANIRAALTNLGYGSRVLN